MTTTRRDERTVHISAGNQDALPVMTRHDAMPLDELVNAEQRMLPGEAEILSGVGGVQPGTHADTCEDEEL